MDTVKKTIFTLLRGALKGEAVSVETPLPFEQLVAEATRHGVENLLFYGLKAAGYTTSDPQMKALLHTVGENIFIGENQLAAANAVCAAFEQNGIDFLPLKGLTLRERYPAPEMRTMSDADILIRVEQYPIIKEVLSSLGLTPVLESDHELVWRQGDTLYLELHKSMHPTYHKDLYAVFGDGWKMAKKIGDTTRYALTPEDDFLYGFTHFAKHYIDGGVGLRYLADLWVYFTAYTDMDMAYVEKMLKKLRLFAFYQNVRAALLCWMEGGTGNEKTAYILEEIWSAGLYGTAEGHAVAGAERDTVSTVEEMKRHRLLRFVFPSAKTLSYQYPVLKKAPVLLPCVWMWRLATRAVFHPLKAIRKGEAITKVSDDAIKERQEALRFVGLEAAADNV